MSTRTFLNVFHSEVFFGLLPNFHICILKYLCNNKIKAVSTIIAIVIFMIPLSFYLAWSPAFTKEDGQVCVLLL